MQHHPAAISVQGRKNGDDLWELDGLIKHLKFKIVSPGVSVFHGVVYIVTKIIHNKM